METSKLLAAFRPTTLAAISADCSESLDLNVLAFGLVAQRQLGRLVGKVEALEMLETELETGKEASNEA